MREAVNAIVSRWSFKPHNCRRRPDQLVSPSRMRVAPGVRGVWCSSRPNPQPERGLAKQRRGLFHVWAVTVIEPNPETRPVARPV